MEGATRRAEGDARRTEGDARRTESAARRTESVTRRTRGATRRTEDATRGTGGTGGRVRWRSDEGAGSVLTLAIAAVVVVLAVALGLCVQATVARSRAQSVADLSALAAAREAQRAAFGEPGATDPCARAAEVAVHNGGTVVRCTALAAGRIAVDAAVSTPLGTARATALAGPRSR